MVSEEKDKNDLPLFGDWQTEEYQPPIAVDGRVCVCVCVRVCVCASVCVGVSFSCFMCPYRYLSLKMST